MKINPLVLFVILGMAFATYLTRAGGFWLMSRFTPSKRLERGLRAVPRHDFDIHYCTVGDRERSTGNHGNVCDERHCVAHEKSAHCDDDRRVDNHLPQAICLIHCEE